MIPKLYKEKSPDASPAHLSLSVLLVMQFEPRITPKPRLEQKLKTAMATVEEDLYQNFPRQMVRPALNKLNHLINTLDYSTQRKSIAIFLSPFIEKLYYLNIPVKEKICVGRYFNMRDLVQNKKEEKNYLVLALSKDAAAIFSGSGSKLMRIVFNSATPGNGNGKQEEALSTKFLKMVDRGLSLMLQCYRLPLLVVAEKRAMDRLRQVTENEKHVVEYVTEHIETLAETTVARMIQPQISNWNKLKEKYLLMQLEKAQQKGKLYAGINEVWKAAKEKKSYLLLIEKDYNFPAYIDECGEMIYMDAIPLSPSAGSNDAVNDAIEKVLADGGNVEFVENGTLKAYRHIALLQE